MSEAAFSVISLGWGVQSFTLAAMAALGDLDCRIAVHADTGWEHEATYKFAEEWTPWLRQKGLNVVTVKNHLRDPYVPSQRAVYIPALTTDGKGSKGAIRRQCTLHWKIRPLRRVISYTLKKHGIPKSPGIVDVLLGISMDEFERARDADVAYLKHRFPLLEPGRRMTRTDCAAYLQAHDLPVPGKSSCVFCPYQSGSAWKSLTGKDLETAVAVDEQIRDGRPPDKLFVHPSRKPLREVLDLPVLPQTDEDGCPGSYCFI